MKTRFTSSTSTFGTGDSKVEVWVDYHRVEAATNDQRRGMSRILRLSFWLASALSLPVLVAALWIGLFLGEPIYWFIVRLQPPFIQGMWRLIVICRCVAWLLVILSLVYLVLYARLLRARQNPSQFRGRLISVWSGLIVTFALVVFWVQIMMPVVSLDQGSRTPKGGVPKPVHLGTSPAS